VLEDKFMEQSMLTMESDSRSLLVKTYGPLMLAKGVHAPQLLWLSFPRQDIDLPQGGEGF